MPFDDPALLLEQQREQFAHDRRNHSDIVCLPRADRLKHYGLHFAKYAGRMARGDAEEKSQAQTVVDAILVSLSAANALSQHLDQEIGAIPSDRRSATLERLTDAAGRFADACEKIDHLEDFLALAKTANVDIMLWSIAKARELSLDVNALLQDRRRFLGSRAFYVKD
ncbi:hypothetical protein [Devosia sediminis]|uniref:Uncharacterized protein n=1 Tax=Devosia sediminis TaxID=2798801 RepID=A0A934IYV4_9HYPH|nr:hypothetical protein [Devosia sediminis]MBJ3785620.1 hypothetical protein [Devosia sediminis]